MPHEQADEEQSSSRTTDGINRRDVLRKGATAGGALIVGGSATGSAAARKVQDGGENEQQKDDGCGADGCGDKLAGRGQIRPREDHEFELKKGVPFKLMFHGTVQRQSCSSDDSEMQTYHKYMLTYCTGDSGWDVWLFVDADESNIDISQDGKKVLYAFQSVSDCQIDDATAKHVEFKKVSMGPCGDAQTASEQEKADSFLDELGGCGQLRPREDHEFELKKGMPFKLMFHSTVQRPCCSSDDSGMQTYHKYMLTYCMGDEGWDVWLFADANASVVDVNHDGKKILYAFGSITDCQIKDATAKHVEFEQTGMGPCGDPGGH